MTKRNSTGAPTKKQRVTNTETFKKVATEVHSGRYLYDCSVYTKSKEPIMVRCRKHGIYQTTPTCHLGGGGCRKCADELNASRLRYTFEQFKAKADKAHDNKYFYDKSSFTGCMNGDKIRFKCSLHGWHVQFSGNHMHGQGCPKCGQAKKGVFDTESFIKQAKAVHGYEYLYDVTEFVSSRAKIKVRCRTHGVIEVLPTHHLRGAKCLRCAKEEQGFTRSVFRKSCKRNGDNQGILYAIQCFNDDEVFYKVGITSKSVAQRFSAPSDMPYDYLTLYEVKDAPDVIYDLEIQLHRALREFQYVPDTGFGGHQTECFTRIKPIEQLLKRLTSTEQLQLIA